MLLIGAFVIALDFSKCGACYYHPCVTEFVHVCFLFNMVTYMKLRCGFSDIRSSPIFLSSVLNVNTIIKITQQRISEEVLLLAGTRRLPDQWQI